MANKEKKPKSKLRKIIENVLGGILIVLIGAAVVFEIAGLASKKDNHGIPCAFGYSTFVVETDSMEPTYKVDTAIITYKQDIEKIIEDFENGEEVNLTFFDSYSTPFIPDDTALTRQTTCVHYAMTHQLVEYHINESVQEGNGRYVFVVHGINQANEKWSPDQYQVFTEQYLLGRVVVGSAFIGGIARFISSWWGLLILLLIPSFYLIITSVLEITSSLKEDEAEEGSIEGMEQFDPGTVEALNQLTPEDREKLKQQLLDEMLEERANKK